MISEGTAGRHCRQGCTECQWSLWGPSYSRRVRVNMACFFPVTQCYLSSQPYYVLSLPIPQAKEKSASHAGGTYPSAIPTPGFLGMSMPPHLNLQMPFSFKSQARIAFFSLVSPSRVPFRVDFGCTYPRPRCCRGSSGFGMRGIKVRRAGKFPCIRDLFMLWFCSFSCRVSYVELGLITSEPRTEEADLGVFFDRSIPLRPPTFGGPRLGTSAHIPSVLFPCYSR